MFKVNDSRTVWYSLYLPKFQQFSPHLLFYFCLFFYSFVFWKSLIYWLRWTEFFCSDQNFFWLNFILPLLLNKLNNSLFCRDYAVLKKTLWDYGIWVFQMQWRARNFSFTQTISIAARTPSKVKAISQLSINLEQDRILVQMYQIITKNNLIFQILWCMSSVNIVGYVSWKLVNHYKPTTSVILATLTEIRMLICMTR